MTRWSCSVSGSRRVEQDDGDLGGLDRGRRAQARVVLHAAGLVDPAPQPGGVDESPDLAVEFDEAVDRVDGRAGDGVDDRTLLAGEPVEQAGLADVRPSDQGDPARAALDVGVLGCVRQRVQDGVEQVTAAPAVQPADE